MDAGRQKEVTKLLESEVFDKADGHDAEFVTLLMSHIRNRGYVVRCNS